MSSQVIPGGSQNSCCHSHSYRERAILEGEETRIKWALHTRKPVSTSQWSQGRITPLLRLHLAVEAEQLWDGALPQELITCSLILIICLVNADFWHQAKMGKMTKSASEFNKVLVPNFSGSQIPFYSLVLWEGVASLLYVFMYISLFSVFDLLYLLVSI